jgi:hypothetical protein
MTERTFDATLDDVCVDQRYARALETHRVHVGEVEAALGLAAIFGRRLYTPVSCLADHSDLLWLAEQKDWGEVIGRVVQPVAKESTWDEALRDMGGTPTSQPAFMTSDAGSRRKMEQEYRTKGYKAGQEYFKEIFGKRCERLKEIFKFVGLCGMSLTPYQPALMERLRQLGLEHLTKTDLRNATRRSDAFRAIQGLEESLTRTQADRAYRAAILARWDQNQKGLDWQGLPAGKPTSGPVRLPPRMILYEVPVLTRLLSESTGADPLLRILDDPELRNMQTDLRECPPKKKSSALKKLCRRAAAQFGAVTDQGMCSVGSYLGTASLAVGLAAMGAAGLMMAFPGIVLLLAIHKPKRGSRVWTRLHCHSTIYRELRAQSRGAFWAACGPGGT